MLHKDPSIISPSTFELIQLLQDIPELKDFILVGGTSLALQIGHRNSIDIDLFTRNEFINSNIKDILADNNLAFRARFDFKNTMIGEINGVKVDFIRHNYDFVNPPITKEGITYLSMEDISAMKLNVITDSGKRLKDFIDIFFLLEHFSLHEILKFYTIKYPLSSNVIALKAINYFDDIDPDFDPPKMKMELPLEVIKGRINEAVLKSKKVF